MHLLGMGFFAMPTGSCAATILFVVVASFFGLHLPDANFAAALVVLASRRSRSSASG